MNKRLFTSIYCFFTLWGVRRDPYLSFRTDKENTFGGGDKPKPPIKRNKNNCKRNDLGIA